MGYKDTVDLHVHTDNSPDANHSATLMCEKACEKGLRAIAITDHCECDAYKSERYDLSTRQSVFEAVKAKRFFTGELIVLAGIELGQPLHNLEAASDALKNPLDFVLASNHTLTTHKEDFFYLDYTLPENNPDKLFMQYLNDIDNIIDWGNFDSLAHLTYPLRYIVEREKIPFELGKYMAYIEDILKKLAKNGKALEINTSGLRHENGTTMPPFSMVKLFKEVGGEYITIGSDCHSCNDIGNGVDKAYDMAKQAGFDFVTIYMQRAPIAVSIK
ncbi:MAG: histidinol-phosphatase HisJ family protein [Oscillospiraceae bacterium]